MKNTIRIWVFAVLSILFIFIILFFTLLFGWSADETSRGTFGDMFGTANALFTGLSFIGLIITILLQRRDLDIQKDELHKQTSSIHIQNFEGSFFQMLIYFTGLLIL